MSDRSGVGAPMHDGAELEPSGEEERDETASSATLDGGDVAGSGRVDGDADGEGGEQVSPMARAFGRISESLFGARDESVATGPPAGVPSGPAGRADGDGDADRDTEDAVARPRFPARAAVTGRKPERSSSPAQPAQVTSPTPADDRVEDPAPPPEPREATSMVESAPAAPTSWPGDAGAVAATPVPPAAVRPAAVAPADGRSERARGPLRARQVHRVVRRVDPWSVLKLSLVFFFCVWLMVLVSAVLVWGVAVGSGTVDGLEGFIERLLAFEEFRFNADQIFRLFAMGGLIMVFLATALAAILAVLFNLISDLIGGIRLIVIEEETTRRIIRRG